MEKKRVSGAGFCSAGSRSPSLATGRAIIINIICLHHSPCTFAFSCHYEDGMLINEHGRHSAIRPVPHPPPAPSLCVPFQPSIPKRDGRPICFPASAPLLFYSRLLLFALKGTNSIHSYDKEALIEEWRDGEKKAGGEDEERHCPGGNVQPATRKRKIKKLAE